MDKEILTDLTIQQLSNFDNMCIATLIDELCTIRNHIIDSEWTNVRVSIDQSYDYYEDCISSISIVGDREETDEELLNRIEDKKVSDKKDLDKKRIQYEYLKKIFEDQNESV